MPKPRGRTAPCRRAVNAASTSLNARKVGLAARDRTRRGGNRQKRCDRAAPVGADRRRRSVNRAPDRRCSQDRQHERQRVADGVRPRGKAGGSRRPRQVPRAQRATAPAASSRRARTAPRRAANREAATGRPKACRQGRRDEVDVSAASAAVVRVVHRWRRPRGLRRPGAQAPRYAARPPLATMSGIAQGGRRRRSRRAPPGGLRARDRCGVRTPARAAKSGSVNRNVCEQMPMASAARKPAAERRGPVCPVEYRRNERLRGDG